MTARETKVREFSGRSFDAWVPRCMARGGNFLVIRICLGE